MGLPIIPPIHLPIIDPKKVGLDVKNPVSLIPTPIGVPLGMFGKANDLASTDKTIHMSQLVTIWPAAHRKEAIGEAGAESGFNPKAVNSAPCDAKGNHAVGLWQVCTNHAGILGSPKDVAGFTTWLQNPENNAKAAHAIWSAAGGTFARDWPTWNNGAWRKYANQDPTITVNKNTLTGDIANTASDVVNAVLTPIEVMAKLVGALFDPSTYLRLGKGALGGVLVIAGTGAIVFIVANRASGGKVAHAAAAATE